MEYEVRPTRVGSRSRRPVVAGTVGLVAFIVAAVVIASTSPAPSRGLEDRIAVASPTLAASATPVAPAFVARGDASTVEDLDLESIHDVDGRVVRCHGMDNPGCQLLARVAATVVTSAVDGGPAVVRRVDVSSSLLCNSDADCPRDMLSRMNPFGSAIVEIAGHPTAAWVNVTRVLAPGGAMHVWIIRWADVAQGSLGSVGLRTRLIGR